MKKRVGTKFKWVLAMVYLWTKSVMYLSSWYSISFVSLVHDPKFHHDHVGDPPVVNVLAW